MFVALKRNGLGGVPVLAAMCFAAGVMAGALVAPVGAARVADAAPPVPGQGLRSGHPGEIVRVIDGDTFEARVRIWPGVEMTTRVRLRGIDAPELHGRCEAERAKAVAARDGLTQMLNEGGVGLSNIGQDKYGGRVDADVSTARTADVGAAMFERGLARRYHGGRRRSWCG